MALPTCDKLTLPIELISLVKSYAWHDLPTKRNKYEVIQELKSHTVEYDEMRIYGRLLRHYNYLNKIYICFCDCGNYRTRWTPYPIPNKCVCVSLLMSPNTCGR